jgi:hypothetical protein
VKLGIEEVIRKYCCIPFGTTVFNGMSDAQMVLSMLAYCSERYDIT